MQFKVEHIIVANRDGTPGPEQVVETYGPFNWHDALQCQDGCLSYNHDGAQFVWAARISNWN